MNARAPWNTHIPSAQRAIDAAVLFICLGLGVLGLHSAFGGNPRYLLAGFGGAALGLVLAYSIVRYRLAFLPAAGIGIAIYLLAGTVLATPAEATAGFVPNLESLRTLLAGIVLSWKDMLTVAPPVGIRAGVLVVPFLGAYATALVAGLFAWRLRSPFWTTLPLTAMFIIGIVFGTREVPLPLLRGLVLVMALVCWLAWRRQVDRAAGLDQPTAKEGLSTPGARQGLRRIGLGAAVLLVAGALTAIASPALQMDQHRQVLRDAVVPPVDLYDYPSPLMSFRKYAKDNADEALLSVTGLPEGQRVRLAALDSYDGIVYDVDPRSGGNFTPVGDAGNVNASAAGDPLRSRGSLGFTIEGYHGVWLPGGGKLLGLDATGKRSEELARSLYYNDDAETALSTTGLKTGDSYTATVEYPVQIDRKKLQAYGLSDVTMPQLANVPQLVSGKAAEMAGDGSTGVERAAAMEGILHETGYFSNGKENQVPSLSGHGAARIASLLDADSMIGDDEQYAVAMALMARDQGMPARVVMGFYPEKYKPSGTVEIKGSDVHAWVEIAFENVGWVTFTPTPDKDKDPTPPQQEPQSVPQPQVLQPPPPPQDKAKLPPETAPDPQEVDDSQEEFWAFWGPILTVTLSIVIPLLILMLPLLVVAVLKLRRRKRRLGTGGPGSRLGGGWSEVISLATDLGARPDPSGTRRENARALGEDFPRTEGKTAVLARRADAAVFGTAEPTEAQIADYWQLVDEQLAGMSSSVGFWGRMRGRYSPRSLVLDATARVKARRAKRGAAKPGIRTVGTPEEKE